MTVLFLDTVHEVLQQRLSQKGFECIDASGWSREQSLIALTDAEGIVIRSRFPMNADFLSRANKLKFIARSGAGMENIDLDYTTKRGILCFNAPEGNRNAVAEHALGMLLSLFNKLNKGDREVRQGIWDREGNRGIELDGKTVGIIGYGNNGSAFAKKLSGFETEVLSYDKYKQNYEDGYTQEATMEELFEKCDVLSFHIPQNEETIYMADEAFFNKFRKPIYVINLSRGKIIKTAALLQGLSSGKIPGACLDVLEYESASFEKVLDGTENNEFKALLQSEKVIFSPHVGGWTKESYFKLSNILADKILNEYGLL
ncbi:MAG: NAD(P)-dependent oxidoreductase [Brumimicrobium sp.]|nr:NAD(P)-dependent oxidoreductase [Brumimicrobium sp.]